MSRPSAAIVLLPDELRALTGKSRSSAQEKVLASMAVPFRKRPDGSLVVIRTDLLAAPTGRSKEPALRFGS